MVVEASLQTNGCESKPAKVQAWSQLLHLSKTLPQFSTVWGQVTFGHGTLHKLIWQVSNQFHIMIKHDVPTSMSHLDFFC